MSSFNRFCSGFKEGFGSILRPRPLLFISVSSGYQLCWPAGSRLTNQYPLHIDLYVKKTKQTNLISGIFKIWVSLLRIVFEPHLVTFRFLRQRAHVKPITQSMSTLARRRTVLLNIDSSGVVMLHKRLCHGLCACTWRYSTR